MPLMPDDPNLCQSLQLWDAAAEPRQEAASRALHALLVGTRRWRHDWEYAGLSRCELGRQSRRLPRYVYGGQPFGLVPGAVTRLGWEPQPLALDPRQRRDWEVRVLVEGGELPVGGFEALLRGRLSAARHLRVFPFLIHLTGELVGDGVGGLADEAEVHAALARELASDGFRLPSGDEWEWAARGGEPGLFRWGDGWPPATPNSSSCPFEQHRLPNGFGLSLPFDTFGVECVADPAYFVGGDGGDSLQGERPPLECWTPLASAYRFPAAAAGEALGSYLELASFRRVLPLAPLLAATDAEATPSPVAEREG